MNREKIFGKIKNIDFDSLSVNELCFYYGYFISITNSISIFEIEAAKDIKLSLINIHQSIKRICKKLGVNYNEISNFELGQSFDGEDIGSVYPSGVLEVCFLLDQISSHGKLVKFVFLAFGKALAYYDLNLVTDGELAFLINLIPLKVLLTERSHIDSILHYYYEEDRINRLLKQIKSSCEIDREISTNLLSFPPTK